MRWNPVNAIVVGSALVAVCGGVAWWLSRASESLGAPPHVASSDITPIREVTAPVAVLPTSPEPVAVRSFEAPPPKVEKETKPNPPLAAPPASTAKLAKRIGKILDSGLPEGLVLESLGGEDLAKLNAEVVKAEAGLGGAHAAYTQTAFKIAKMVFDEKGGTKFASESITEPDPMNPGATRMRASSPYDTKKEDEFIVERGVAMPDGTVENHVLRLRPGDSPDYDVVWNRYSAQAQEIRNSFRTYLGGFTSGR